MTSASQHQPRVALVTGAGRGIGRGIATALGARNWRVLVNYRSDADSAASCVQQIEDSGGEARSIQADVASADGRATLLRESLAAWGGVDLLVNNAGMAPRQRVDILEMSEASYDEVMGVNLRGPFFLTQAIARHMLAAERGGTIINISSMSAVVASTSRGEYCISKAGMGMMTKLFADRLADQGILVYELRPGIVETDMTAVVLERYQRLVAEGLTPIRRLGLPEDVARACLAIVEGHFPFSTGEVINVDGGQHLQRL
ncbi:MAG: 3-ketoacyl-ACP reductase [Anaerolineae bacterium]|nr:3-ketoacyl-ACP reductase [Anaerolineae bacterium]